MNPNYGDSIEDYEVLDLLGKGGFATVFRAKSKRNNQEVAIKKIDRKLMQARNMVSRVKNEIMVHHQLKHPSVLELHNFFEDENYVYLVLELCHNGALNKFLKTKQKKLREADASRLFRQVVEGLLYLHSHMIMHRDLSLSNILLTKSMDAKIADFGLSIQLKAEDEKHYTMCGTANYIAPEVAERGPHGLESDVWSLGCMLYTMVVGHPPFDTEGLTNTLLRVVSAEFKLPRELSPEAQNIISAMLKKNPSKRLKLSEILTHPFMARPSHAHDTTQLYQPQRHTHVPPRGLNNSLGSIDSGHETQCTTVSSSNHTPSPSSRQGHAHHGPMRATVVPRGVMQYAPPTSNPRSAGGSSSHHHNTDTSRPHNLDTATWPHQGGHGLPPRRASSLEALGMGGGGEEREAWSYHSDSPQGARQRRASQEGNKENHLSSKPPFTANQGTRRPLQDNTNSSSGRRGSWSPVRVASAKDTGSAQQREQREQVGSLKGLVPPLNAARLRPMTQHKQNAVISVTETGKVCIKLLSHRGGGGSGHAPSELRSGSVSSLTGGDSEIIQISSNGMEIELFHPLTPSTHPRHSASLEHEGFYLHTCYTYHDLPSRYWKKYQYASQFVELLRSRTAKVTLYTDLAKCVLMENAPNPNYEANFYNGVKVHQSANLTRFVDQGGHAHSVEGGGDVPQAMLLYHEHALEGLERCREIEEAMTGLERQGGGGVYFPVMAGRKRHVGGGEDQQLPRPSSAATSIASCATLTTRGGGGRDGGGRGSQRAVSRSCSRENLSLGHQRARSSSVSSGGRGDQDGAGPDTVICSVRVDGAGKAVQLASGVVVIKYNDGSQLRLQSSSCAAFKYTDPQGKDFMFNKTDKVPGVIKSKLDYLPKVMDHFLRQSQKQ